LEVPDAIFLVTFKFYQVTDLRAMGATELTLLLCPLGPLWPNPENCSSIPVPLYTVTENQQIYRTFVYIFMSLLLMQMKINSVLSAC
jgi:hypothetical protein